MSATVFYSWQSDLDKKTNHFFIRDALRAAIQQLQRNPDSDLEVRIDLDSDTQNTAGAPDIVRTIFDKIERCEIFVCDVSIIGETAGKRKTPNPNVLLELGYATRRLGWERIICVFNDTSGELPHDLPFDLRTRRIMRYRFTGETSEKSQTRKNLTDTFVIAIQQILKDNPPPRALPLGEKEQIERQRDIRVLRGVFECFNTDALDIFFNNREQGLIPIEVLFAEERLQALTRSSHYHFYDNKLKQKIHIFVRELRLSLSDHKDIVLTPDPSVYKFGPQDRRAKVLLERFAQVVRRVQLNLGHLLSYVRNAYHEIEFTQTNAVAAAAYEQQANSFVPAFRRKVNAES